MTTEEVLFWVILVAMVIALVIMYYILKVVEEKLDNVNENLSRRLDEEMAEVDNVKESLSESLDEEIIERHSEYYSLLDYLDLKLVKGANTPKGYKAIREKTEVLGTLREKYPEEFYNILGDYLGEDPKYLPKTQDPEEEYSYRILKHMKEEYSAEFDTELSTYTGRNMMLYWVSPVEQETLLLGLDVYGEDLWFVESEQQYTSK